MPSSPAIDDTWRDRRGEDQFRGSFDAIGGFPGYPSSAALIVNGTLVVTSRYLLVDEWAPHGFGLPLRDLIDISVDADPDTFEDVLVRYRTDSGPAMFRLRAARSRIPVRGKSRVSELTAAFGESDVPMADLARTLADAFSASWESLQAADSDAVVWKGRVTAPLRPGRECAPTEVWVTPAALIWGSSRGRGVNRVPLSAIERLGSAALNDPAHSPAVYIRTAPIADTCIDMPFIFNLGGPAAGTEQRDAFLSIFRGDAVQDIDTVNHFQPWSDEPDRADMPPTEPASDAPPEDVSPTLEAADQETEPDGAASEPPESVFETWADLRRPSAIPYGPGEDHRASRRLDATAEAESYSFDSSGTRLVDALTAWPGATSQAEEQPPEPAPITEPRVLLTYLAKARRAIDEVNQAVDRRIAGQAAPLLRSTPPSSDEQSQALAELIELAGTDYYSVEQARSVKTQITRMGEAAIRLRSLLELCNAGHMTITEVGQKRDVIMSGLPADEGIE